MGNAEFRVLCHGLGLSAHAVATLGRVQERTVRHWWSTGQPPEDVWQAVRAIDKSFAHMAADAVQKHTGSTGTVTLLACRDERTWWRAQPMFEGLPIQAHSALLQRMRDALTQAGHQVAITYGGNEQ